MNYYTDGGGILPFTAYNSGSQTYATQIKSQARLTRTSASSYEMLFPDGSRSVFSQPDSTITNVCNKLTIAEVNGSLWVHENADAPPP